MYLYIHSIDAWNFDGRNGFCYLGCYNPFVRVPIRFEGTKEVVRPGLGEVAEDI